MEFAAMKRTDLQALCKRHGLAAGGTNAALVARLTATLSEEAVGVVVGKGCLKRTAAGASGGDSDAARKVTFELEEDEAAEVGVAGRGRRRSQVFTSPAVAKTRGRQKAGEAPPAAKGTRRWTRSQPAGGDSADESDSGEAGADPPARRAGRNAVNLGAGDGAERADGAGTRKNSGKAEQEEVDVGDAVGRKHQLKRKTRENDIEDADVSGQVGVSRRSTRSSGVLSGPDALSSPVEKKRGRKAADVKEKPCVEEQPKEALQSGRTLRSGVVLVAPAPPIVSESKKSRGKVQEEEPAVEKVSKAEIRGRTTRSSSVAPVPPIVSESKKSRGKVQEEEPAVEKVVVKAEIPGRTTRSSSVAPAVASPRVIVKKRGRKTGDVQSDGGPDEKMENKRQSSRLTTGSSIHQLASSGDEASLEQVAAPSKGLQLRRSRRNPSEANMMLNSNTTSESSNGSRAPTEFNGPKIPRPSMVNAAKDGVEYGVEKPDRHVGLKKSKPRNVSSTVATNGGEITFSESSGKACATDMQIKVPGPLRRSTRKSVVPTFLEHETNGMHEDVEKKQTVTKPVGRSTRRSVAPVILEKESKGLSKEIVPEAHVKRPTRKSVVPAMLEKGRKSIITEIIPEARVKRPIPKPALPMVNSENNDHCVVVNSECEEFEKQPTVKQPVKRLTRKCAAPALLEVDRKGLPDMLNNENGDCTEMQSDKVGHLEKQLVVKEPVRGSTGKSVVPDVNESKGLHEELKLEVSVRTPVCKSVVPNVVNKENDESLHRTTRKSSKLAISPSQSKPTASKGRPAKRRRTSSLQEDMPAEEQKEDQIAYEAHTNDVIEVATSTALEIGVLPFAAEKSDLQDSQLNSELEGIVVVKSGAVRGEDDRDILEIEMDGTVGTTEKPPSNLPLLDCKDVGTIPEEVVRSIENDAGRCSPKFGQSPTGPQFLFSHGIAEKSATHNAIPCPENCVEESDVHKVKCQVETVVPSKFESYRCSDENSVRFEESVGCMFSSQQNNEQEGASVFSCSKDLVASAQLDLSEDVDHVVRDVITEDLVCKEEEKKDSIPSSDINVPHQISHANEPAENASGASGAVICISQSTPISDEVNSDSSRLESSDALDIRIASSNTEAAQQDNKEEFNLHNGVTDGIHTCVMSEAAQVEVSKSEKMQLPDKETSAFRDAQLNRKREGNDIDEHRFSCGKEGAGKNNMSQLANESVMDYCQEQEHNFPHDLSAVKSPKGYKTCQDEFVIGSGIGRTSGSIVIGNNIAMDAPVTAKQGDILSPSATAVLRNRETTHACKIDAPELRSDHLFAMDSSANPSARRVQSVSGKLREAGLSVGNSDNRLRMEQVQQDDVQVLDGVTKSCHEQEQMACQPQLDLLEAANCMKHFTNLEEVSYDEENNKPVHSADISSSYEKIDANGPVKHASGLVDGLLSSSLIASTDDTDVHPSSNPYQVESTDFLDELKGCSSTDALQQGLKEQNDERKENQVTYGACPRDMIEGDTAKDLESEVPPLPAEKASNMPEYLFLEESSKGSDMHGDHVLPSAENVEDSNTCHVELQNEKMVSSEPDSSKGSNMHGYLVLPCAENEDDPSTCHVEPQVEKMISSEPDSHKGSHEDLTIVEGIRSCVFSSQLEHEKDEQLIAPLLAVETLALLDQQANPELEAGESEKCNFSSEVTSGKIGTGYGMNRQFELHQDSHMDPTQGKELPDDLPAPKSPEQSAACQDAETSALRDEQPNPELESSEIEERNLSSEDTSGVVGAGYVEDTLFQFHEDSHTDPIQGKGLPDDVPAPKSPAQSAAVQDAETSALWDEQPNPELNGGELKERNLSIEDTSGIFDTGYVKTNSFQLHEDSHMDPIQGKGLPDDVPAPKSPAQSAAGQDAETSALWDEQPNPELKGGELKERNLSSEDTSGIFGIGYVKTNSFQLHEDSHMDPNQGKELPDDAAAPKSPAQSTIGQDTETPASPDEQPNPELDSSEIEERNLSSEGTSGVVGAGYVEDTLFQFHEDSHMDPIQGKGLPDDVPAPKSPAQSAAGQDAETSASPDEQPNHKLDSSEFEEQNLRSEDTSGMFGTGYVEDTLFQFHEDSHMDPIQEKGLPDDVPAPKSPAQSAAGQDAETSASPDEQPNPKLDSCEFEEQNLRSEDTSGMFGTRYADTLFQFHEDSHMDPIQGKGLPNDRPAPKSPAQSAAGQDAETSASPDEQPNPKLDSCEFEEQNLRSEDTSGMFGTGYVDTLFQFHEDSHMDPIQGKGLPNDRPAPKSPEQSTICHDAETSAWSDEQLNPKLEVGEFVKHNFSSEDTSGIFGTGYAEDTLFQLQADSRTDPIQGKEPPNYLPANKSPNQSTIGQDENVLGPETSPLLDEKLGPELEGEEFEEHNLSCDKAAIWDYKEEYNDENNDDQATAAMLSSGMTKPTPIEGSGSGMSLLSATGTPALTNEQLNSKLEGNEEDSLCFDADNIYISDTGLMENNTLSSLPFFEHELPIGTPVAKSSGESVVFRDNSAPGSIGTCQTSGRRRIDEISTKPLSFKISSAVKGSYIAMDSAKTKQGGNLRPTSLLRDTENVPAANLWLKEELNTDLLDVKDSPRQGTPDGS